MGPPIADRFQGLASVTNFRGGTISARLCVKIALANFFGLACGDTQISNHRFNRYIRVSNNAENPLRLQGHDAVSWLEAAEWGQRLDICSNLQKSDKLSIAFGAGIGYFQEGCISCTSCSIVVSYRNPIVTSVSASTDSLG